VVSGLVNIEKRFSNGAASVTANMEWQYCYRCHEIVLIFIMQNIFIKSVVYCFGIANRGNPLSSPQGLQLI
jgi:hypothetical protein